MPITPVCICDSCNRIISDPTDGFIIEGNIYVAHPTNRGGLVGNNFPTPDGYGQIRFEDIKSSVFCKTCLLDIISRGSLQKPF